jgi:hypothetical protein
MQTHLGDGLDFPARQVAGAQVGGGMVEGNSDRRVLVGLILGAGGRMLVRKIFGVRYTPARKIISIGLGLSR